MSASSHLTSVERVGRAARWMTAAGAVLIALSALAGPAAAQTQERAAPPRLPADRPGLGDGAVALGTGVWMAELGGTIQAVVNDEYLFSDALVRTGFAGVEMRLTVPSVHMRHGDEFLQLGDLGLGVKVPLDLGGAWWQWAALGTLTLPTGSEFVSAGDPALNATFIGQVELAADADLVLNTGWGFVFGDFGGGSWSLIATPTFPFPGREGVRFYVGYAGFIRSGHDDHIVEWGLTRMDGSDRQWDLNAGYDPGSHDWFLGVGVAARSAR